MLTKTKRKLLAKTRAIDRVLAHETNKGKVIALLNRKVRILLAYIREKTKERLN